MYYIDIIHKLMSLATGQSVNLQEYLKCTLYTHASCSYSTWQDDASVQGHKLSDKTPQCQDSNTSP